MRRIIKFPVLINILTICILLCWLEEGECAVQRDFQTWPNVLAIGRFSHADTGFGRIRVWLEAQQRIGDDSSKFTQILFRPGLGYALTKNLSMWMGYGWIRTGVPLTNAPFGEHRIWEQLLWEKTNPHFTFISRTRLEQRYFQNRFKMAFRVRQLLRLVVPLDDRSRFSFVSNDELFWHHNDYIGRKNSEGFDQNRYFIGLGYKINTNATTEIGYMNQYIRRFDVPNFLAHIVSVNLFLNF
ncbi:DUF2490 domain-containing protein [Legionella drozanskii]|uniref:DUF2490 domain-containing protein n=1 Tax=Legionella drozanskii LLAP-1 TaxID=1212489 RepID=A0A0W0TDX4_9GAMM|nr:DUF2490 domain-containing protein [Legionella drozanskii]KTC93760.1 hypothetical protein Ldro_0110 [Legionella drozanskii LLAP-1]